MLFLNIIVPVFLVIGAGFVFEKAGRLDFRPLTDASLYLFSPALVLTALIKHDIGLHPAVEIFVFMLLYTMALTVASFICGRVLRYEDDQRRALTLTTAMMNVGNFGLPLAYFAFGETGLEVSIITFVIFNIPLGTLAIVIAQGQGTTIGKALANTAKIPIFHAVIIAALIKSLNVWVPIWLLRPLELMGQAAIPVMLLLLGMQLARTRIAGSLSFLGLAAVLRLVLAPLLAWGLTTVLGIRGMVQAVVILQTSTPSAVLPLLYSLRFGTRPDLVAGTIFITTGLSSLSLTVLLYLLK